MLSICVVEGKSSMNDTVPIRPSWWYCLVGLPFLLIGVGFFAYTLVHDIVHLTDSLVQVVAPGHADLFLKPETTYTVFVERQSIVNGRIYSNEQSISGLVCVVSPASGGKPIPLRQPSMSTSYDVNGRSGKSILQFRTMQGGSYQFSCEYANSSGGSEVVLAVGAGVGEKIISTIVKSLAALFGGIGLASIVFLAVFFARESAKRKALQVLHAPA
jgi:hypothetical protein